jgi:glycine cleavage system H protein
MSYPTHLKYTKDHEWAKIEGTQATIGITEHAQKALGDVVYCELPSPGRTLKAHETFGVVESIKAVSDLYSPVAGKVSAANQAVVDDPAMLNQDPHGAAWMIKIEMESASAADGLMDAAAYEAYVNSLK